VGFADLSPKTDANKLDGVTRQFGRASAPIVPHFVHAARTRGPCRTRTSHAGFRTPRHQCVAGACRQQIVEPGLGLCPEIGESGTISSALLALRPGAIWTRAYNGHTRCDRATWRKLMEWSGRAPVPPALNAVTGLQIGGAPPCPTSPLRSSPRWASTSARTHVIGLDRRGAIVLRQKWSRSQIEARVANMPRRAGQDHGLGPRRAVEARPLRPVGRAACATRVAVGSVAFSRRGNPASGKYEAAVILKAFGEMPKDPRHQPRQRYGGRRGQVQDHRSR
jgi:hypothetical protein